MLERVSDGGCVWYRSPVLAGVGVPHAFSTRVGGRSPAPFDSLNLGNPNGCPVQDDYDRIWANYQTLQDATGCGGVRTLCRVHQVHGDHVAHVRRDQPFDVSTRADALVGDDPARVISVRVADCVPILASIADGRHVAAIHAGWRGVVAGAAVRALNEMSRRSGQPIESFRVAIGPCIGPDAFEVGPEVLDEFTRVFAGRAPIARRVGRKGFVDLKRGVEIQLRDAGIPADQIDSTDRCTFRDQAEFFSHRRDNGITGRMAAIIAPRAEGMTPRTGPARAERGG